MKHYHLFLIFEIFYCATDHSQRHNSQPSTGEGMVAEPYSYRKRRPMALRKGADTLQIAGSSLPDCSHACGSCTPCRLVMVSFVCASLEEAETCPMAYKCICNNKSYPVP
ncbi:protein EPIDERMAL PATTERNING FACTOR 1-like [Durio zibethinus]|uniref:Epidermal patterning factor-like protein n=1 Tax=Durio zibethinus TaxID=66656 RepID=A0A6P5XI07_DURZI|nr:protein EPIDERMAL PATTERNING FACTOR 1-like [Durio zibethinus]